MAVVGVLLQDDSRLCHVLLLLKIVGNRVVVHRREIHCVLHLLLLLIGRLVGCNLERVNGNILLWLLLHLMISAKGVGRLMHLLLLADHQILLLHERCELQLLLGKYVAGRLQEEELLLRFAVWRLGALNSRRALIDQRLLTGCVLHEHHLLIFVL